MGDEGAGTGPQKKLTSCKLAGRIKVNELMGLGINNFISMKRRKEGYKIKCSDLFNEYV